MPALLNSANLPPPKEMQRSQKTCTLTLPSECISWTTAPDVLELGFCFPALAPQEAPTVCGAAEHCVSDICLLEFAQTPDTLTSTRSETSGRRMQRQRGRWGQSSDRSLPGKAQSCGLSPAWLGNRESSHEPFRL